MAFYLVRARLNRQLAEARIDAEADEVAWEEENYCRPLLAQERAAVMDHYFRDPQIEPIGHGEGWQRIGGLPKLREAEGP